MSNGKSDAPSDPQSENKAPDSNTPVETNASAGSEDDEADIEALLAKASEGQLDRDQQRKVAQLLSVTISRHEAFSGPYPHPQLLDQYPERVQDEICWLTRSYHEHQKKTDWFDRQTSADERARGQSYGLAIAVVGLLATVVISFTSPVTASIVGALDLLGLTAVFAYPRYLESKKGSAESNASKSRSDTQGED